MKNFKKVISIIIISAMVFNLYGCKSNQAEGKSALDQIKSKGTLVIGTSADYPPYEFHANVDGKDAIVGFDMDIAKEIANDLGVKLEIKDMDFDGLLGALSAKKVDMVVAGMTPTEERKAAVDFSDIYYEATHGIVVKKGMESSITKQEDLNGKVIGVQQGSVQANLAKDTITSPKEIKEVPKITDLILMVQSGKVDAVIMEIPVAKSYVKNNQELGLSSFVLEDKEGGAAVAMKKDSPELVTKVNETLKRLKDQNKVEEFFNNAQQLSDQQQ